MNVVLIICDTVRHDYLGCYGSAWVRTPHLDALAGGSAVMTRFHSASFPTGPMRKDVHSGRFTFAYTDWQSPRPPEEVLLSETLAGAGVRTAYVGDTPNSPQYCLGFEDRRVVPHWAAGWEAVPEDVPLPADPRKLRFPLAHARRIMRNAAAWDGEADRRAARTMLAAHRWLEDRCADGDDRPFFLWVDTFDPHEPWDQPRYYTELYDPGYAGEELIEPAYEPADYASADEVRHMRCLYAGKLTMVDRWVGLLLEGLSRMPPASETAVIFTSDHGYYHGEHGLIGKLQLDREGVPCRRWPLYDTIAHPPLLVRVPGITDGGREVDAFCQPPDLTATILELLGVDAPARVQGRSLLPLVRGRGGAARDGAVSSLTFATDEAVRCPSSFRTTDWLYVYGGDEWPSELYDLSADPSETRNVFANRRAEAERLHRRYLAFLESIDCPRRSLDLRRAFDPSPRADLPYRRTL